MFLLNRNTVISTDQKDTAVHMAICNLKRDISKACKPSEAIMGEIVLVKGVQEKECFHLNIRNGKSFKRFRINGVNEGKME